MNLETEDHWCAQVEPLFAIAAQLVEGLSEICNEVRSCCPAEGAVTSVAREETNATAAKTPTTTTATTTTTNAEGGDEEEATTTETTAQAATEVAATDATEAAIEATTEAAIEATTFTPAGNAADRQGDEDLVACAAIWMPVCGADGTVYSNDCEAGATGQLVLYNIKPTDDRYIANDECPPAKQVDPQGEDEEDLIIACPAPPGSLRQRLSPPEKPDVSMESCGEMSACVDCLGKGCTWIVGECMASQVCPPKEVVEDTTPTEGMANATEAEAATAVEDNTMLRARSRPQTPSSSA